MSNIIYVNKPYCEHGDLDRLIYYICEKPNLVEFQIFGANILNPDYALRSMYAVKNRFKKLDGKQAYHFIFSIRPTQGSSYNYKIILAKWLMNVVGNYIGDLGFQNVAAVHATPEKNYGWRERREENVHVHIVVNSVSAKDGHKLREVYKLLREIKYMVNHNDLLYGINIEKVFFA